MNKFESHLPGMLGREGVITIDPQVDEESGIFLTTVFLKVHLYFCNYPIIFTSHLFG